MTGSLQRCNRRYVISHFRHRYVSSSCKPLNSLIEFFVKFGPYLRPINCPKCSNLNENGLKRQHGLLECLGPFILSLGLRLAEISAILKHCGHDEKESVRRSLSQPKNP